MVKNMDRVLMASRMARDMLGSGSMDYNMEKEYLSILMVALDRESG